MKKLLSMAVLMAFAVPAFAADMPVKYRQEAPALRIFYGGAGGYCGAGLGGEATKIGAAGATSQAVYEAGGLLNLNCGYTFAVGTDRWAAFQANYAYSNTDAKVIDPNTGALVSVEKHQSVDLKAKYGAPLSVLTGIFSNAATAFPVLPAVPTNALVSTMHPYIAAGARVSRDDANLGGIVTDKKIRVKGILGVGAVYQTNTNTTIDTFADWTFGSGRFLLVPGTEIKEGSTFRFCTIINYGLGD